MTRFWALFLNPMRGNTEDRNLIATASDPSILQRILDENYVGHYDDRESGIPNPFTGELCCWNKCYRKGGELEWYNPPEHCPNMGYGIIDLGTLEEFLKPHIEEFNTVTSKWRRF